MSWSVNPSNQELSFLMEAGYIYLYAKRFREARDVFAGVAALVEESEVPQVALGAVAFAEGNLQAAIEHYEEALAKNPKSAFALTHLGEAYLFKGNLERAQDHLEQASRLDPKGFHGKVASHLGKFRQLIQSKS